jgi:O-methyltransferase
MVALLMQSLLRKAFCMAQSALDARGIHVTVSRISERNRPELINRAIWRPLVADDRWRALYSRTQSATNGTATDNIFRQCRFYSTFQLARYAARLPQGDVIECGCWHGHSTLAIATLLAEESFSGRFHVFDSFEGGLSDFGVMDESSFRLTEEEKRAQIELFRSDFDLVKSVTARFGFVELHRGWIPQTFESFERRPVRFVHIDVDMYEPTKASLEFFWDSVIPGGCIVIDDYNHAVFEGATRAVDEFLANKAPRLFYSVPFGSAYIIK